MKAIQPQSSTKAFGDLQAYIIAAWMILCDLAEKRSFSFQIRFAAAVDFVCYDSSHLLVCRASLFFVFRHHRRCGAGLNKKKESPPILVPNL